MNKHLSAALAIARRHAKRYAEGGLASATEEGARYYSAPAVAPFDKRFEGERSDPNVPGYDPDNIDKSMGSGSPVGLPDPTQRQYLHQKVKVAARQEGGAVDLPEIKVTPPPPMVSDEDLSMAEVPQAKPPREGGLMQTIPKFVGEMSTPEGRSKLESAIGDYFAGTHIDESGEWTKPQVPGIAKGVWEGIKGPGEVMKGEMTPEQQADWGAGTALGLVGAGTPFAHAMPESGIGVFGGRGSKLADHGALAEAEALEQKGLNQNQIQFRTGWWRDAGTGEWMHHHNMKDATLGPGAYSVGNEFHINPRESHSLDQVLQHPNLYEAYPLLKDWKVIANDVPGQMGSVNYADKTMKIAPQNKEAILDTLTHEANHIIQAYEGFSRGSSVNRWLPAEYPSKMLELWQQATPFNRWIESQGLPVAQVWKAIQKAKEDSGMLNDWDRTLVSNFTRAGKLDEALELVGKQELLTKALNEAFDKYIHVYGEAMSRQSEYRRTMTPEESRRITVPNAMRMLKESPVDPKELIFNTNPLTPTSFPTARERGVPSPYDIEESYRISPEGFYTRADRVVDEKGPKAATADEWMGFLRNQGISPTEDQWVGISDWLKEQKGRISKEELQQHIQSQSPKLGSYLATGASTPARLPEEWGGNPPNLWEDEHPPELEPDWPFNEPHEVIPDPESYGEDTRFSDVTLPGGKNYTELKMRWFPKEIQRSYGSEHFPGDPDLLAAARVDERNIKDKKTLHIHELQSDWHQTGQTYGYFDLHPEGVVPNAPFKNTWDDLLFKKTLRHAVEKGFDQVSWPATADSVKATQKWPELEAKDGKYTLPRGIEVTPIIRRYTKELPKLADKLGKRWGAQVGKAETGGHSVYTLPLTDSFKQAIMKEGFDLKFRKGGKVEQKRTYTMPLKPGSDSKTVSTNIREFHTGPTYAHTAAKFGKERARKQAIAVAMSSARKYAGKGKALGGPNLDMESMVMKNASYGLRREGMINSSVPGRTDKLPMNVKSGSYVLPADIPSALGQGNSTAGGMILKKMFSSGPYGLPTMHSAGRSGAAMRPMKIQQQKMPGGNRSRGSTSLFAKGGEAGIWHGIREEHERVPIVAAGGEYLISPEVVKDIGHGDLKKGHKVLDAFVLRVRKEHISTLKNLKPPKK